jgi:hypothetical protein
LKKFGFQIQIKYEDEPTTKRAEAEISDIHHVACAFISNGKVKGKMAPFSSELF